MGNRAQRIHRYSQIYYMASGPKVIQFLEKMYTVDFGFNDTHLGRPKGSLYAMCR